MQSSVNPCTHGQVEGTIPYQRAAALLGITPKQMAGRIWRDSFMLNDPRGCKVCGDVYIDSLPEDVQAVIKSVAP